VQHRVVHLHAALSTAPAEIANPAISVLLRLPGVSRHRAGLIVIAGLGVVLVLVWLLQRATAPAEPVAAAPTPAPAPAPRPRAASLPAVPTLAARPAEREPDTAVPDLGGHDTIDPCTAVRDAAIPAGYETASAGDITVAWLPTAPGENDAPFQPQAIAYLVTGLLEEAAGLTGTSRRDRLTVILHPSREDLLARTRAPAWSAGLYDGRAVRVVSDPSADLGVPIATLRHELMHAQLHASVGCMPAWLNEGLAQYFASRPPVRGWLQILRTAALDLDAVQGPTLAELSRERAEVAYGASLAMVLYLAQRGEPALRAAVQLARAHDGHLWDQVAPGVRSRPIIESLARRVFDTEPGPALDATLAGAICCWGLRALRGFGCRAATDKPADRRTWFDETRTPHALCRMAW
jgi:hypothetical protein